MLTKIKETIKNHNMLSRGEHVLCALSGGADSSVLLDVLVSLSRELDIKVSAAHLNHMLRGREADEDEAFCKELCRVLGIELVSERLDVAKLSKESGKSIELAARDVRYDFLYRAKNLIGASKIATAHNANDNLETIIFNLARGAGLDGMCGIPPVRGDIIRPLITTSREEIEQYAEENKISFCTDKTNSDTEYSRNRIRHRIIPELSRLNGAAVENASRTSGILREEAAFLNYSSEISAAAVAIDKTSCDIEKLSSLHNALFGRVCQIFARRVAECDSYSLEHCHIENIRAVCNSSSPSAIAELPHGIIARREYEKLVFEYDKGKSHLPTLSLCEGELRWGEYIISVKKLENNGKVNNSFNTFYVPYDTIQSGLVIRPRHEGDKIKLPRRPAKTLKKLFIEKRVPKGERDSLPILACGDEVLAVYGFGQSERALAYEGDMLVIDINRGVEE